MAKKLSAKIGEFTDNQGNTKGRYANLGVVLSNNNGEYLLMDPTVDLGGVLALQNMMARAKGQQERDRVMVSVFDDSNQQRQGGGYQQNNNQGNQGQSGGYDGYGQGGSGLADDIPFFCERRI